MSTGTENKLFDLTAPPTRQAVGLPDAKDQFTHQSPNLSAFPAHILLPEGKELSFEVVSVGVDSLRAADPQEDPPTTMDITYQAATLDLGRDHLLATARDFGLDADAVESWYRQSLSARALPVRSPWLRTTLGYLTFEVRASHSPTRTTVHYVLSWR